MKRPATLVIGASAGGIDALSQLLPAIAADAPFAVLVVIHLPRDRPSLLCEIFQPKCALRVMEASDKEPVVPGTLYFAAPDYHLLIDRDAEGAHLALSADELLNFSRPSIDALFETAAEVYGDRLMAVILTGGNHDGAAGMAAVARAGGQCIVQSPDTAQSPFMPAAALAAAPDARPLSLQDISGLIAALSRKEEPE